MTKPEMVEKDLKAAQLDALSKQHGYATRDYHE